MVNVAPWLVSLFVHLGVIIVALLVVWATLRTPADPPAGYVITGIDGLPQPVSLDAEVKLERTPEQTRSAPAARTPQSRPISETPPKLPSDLIGITGSDAIGSPIGLAPAVGTDGRMFDLPPGGGPTGAPARSIVYIIDASGSLIDTMPFVIEELKRSIRGLNPEQRFTVIFFQNGQPVEVPVPHRGLKQADDDTRRAVAQWIDMSAGNVLPGGKTHATEAIRIALAYRPDVAYILSDDILGGRSGPTPEQLLADVRKYNVASTRVNTIQFFYPDPLEAVGREPVLRQIATETRGQYRFVRPQDIEVDNRR